MNPTAHRLAAAPWARGAALLFCVIAPPAARGLDIVPTFVDDPPGTANRQVWDAARQAVLMRAMNDWESRVLDDRTVNVTFDFTREGSNGYLALWTGDYSLPGGSMVDVYPWTPQVDHYVHFNSDQIARQGARLAFVDAPPAANEWDALTVTRHELGHMMGFVSGFYRRSASDPSSDKWAARVSINPPEATFDPGGLNVPLESSADLGHIKEVAPYANDLMTASIGRGERREIDPLHLEMLRVAYGYQVVPEPGGACLAGACGLSLLRRRRAA